MGAKGPGLAEGGGRAQLGSQNGHWGGTGRTGTVRQGT